MDLVQVAQETVEILRRGWYDVPGARVVLTDDIKSCIASSVYYPEGAKLPPIPDRSSGKLIITVTDETTSQASRRLRKESPCILNFASAKNPGGGFLRGAKAQEEDLARVSSLYAPLAQHPDYYLINRASANGPLYTDGLIISPGVSFFRDENLQLVQYPWKVSVVTCPAPNVGESEITAKRTHTILKRRAHAVLTAMASQSGTAILGAWGCGVFGNDPEMVAGVFQDHLAGDFALAFNHMIFAIPGSHTANHQAFANAF
jgi:uncharacterized protein (TIGR02452 family)